MGIGSSFCSFRGWASIIFLFLLSAAHSVSLSAQTISSGTTLRVGSDQTAISSGNLTISSGAILKNEGLLVIEKNLINKNASPCFLGKGTVRFSGTSVQVISGQNVFHNLIISNPAGVILEGNTRVLGTLTLAGGVITLGDFHLTLGANAVIAGEISPSNMIASTGTGELRKEFRSAGSFTFPVGDLNGEREYSPVTLHLISANFATDNYLAVRVTNEKYPFISDSGAYLNRHWNITVNNISGFICNADFFYTQTDVYGEESQLSCIKANVIPWIVYGPADTAANKLTAIGIQEPGTFTGAEPASKTLLLHVLLESLYSGGGQMRKAQDEYGDHFPGDIADKVTVELHDASSYQSVLFSSSLVNMSITGQVTIAPVPEILNSSYYISIKNRNSIETVSAMPVSFSTGTVNYDFTTGASQAYGDNLKEMDGVFVIYGGDVNQDDIVDAGDRNLIENAITGLTFGYVPEDANGDGIVDSEDINIVDNNSLAIIMAHTP